MCREKENSQTKVLNKNIVFNLSAILYSDGSRGEEGQDPRERKKNTWWLLTDVNLSRAKQECDWWWRSRWENPRSCSLGYHKVHQSINVIPELEMSSEERLWGRCIKWDKFKKYKLWQPWVKMVKKHCFKYSDSRRYSTTGFILLKRYCAAVVVLPRLHLPNMLVSPSATEAIWAELCVARALWLTPAWKHCDRGAHPADVSLLVDWW